MTITRYAVYINTNVYIHIYMNTLTNIIYLGLTPAVYIHMDVCTHIHMNTLDSIYPGQGRLQ